MKLSEPPKRNDPCPCGSGKRYKNCHGDLTPPAADARVDRAFDARLRGDLAGAVAMLDEAITATPHAARAYHLRGIVRQELRDLAGAEADLREATALSPAFAEAHMALGILLLILRRYPEAWPEYEWRTRQPGYKDYANYPFGIPRWRGESLAGKRLLVHAEQGFGDTLQCARFLELAARDCGASVDVWCHPPLAPLIQRVKGVGTAYATLAERPTHDFHAPIIDLAAHYLPSADSPHWFGPYLAPREDRAARWEPDLAPASRPRVGFVWKGSALYANDWQRSLTPELAASLSRRVPDVRFVNLQFGEPPPPGANWIDVGSRLADWEDTVGVIAHLDLLIAVDTGVVHVAGAMGKPVWVLRPFPPEWRWGSTGESSPWYPTATILRQRAPWNWESVLDATAERLRA